MQHFTPPAHPAQRSAILLVILALCHSASPATPAQTDLPAKTTVTFNASDLDGAPLPCRIYLFNEENKPQRPPGRPFWEGGFVCDGAATLTVDPGAYRYEIEHGPEWSTASNRFTLAKGQTLPFTEQLRRITDLRSEGWFSGDLHVHRAVEEIPLHLRAEDLDIASVQTWWNETNPWKSKTPPSNPIHPVDSQRFYHSLSGEDERGGGALLFHGMTTPIDITGSHREWPSSVAFLQRADQNQAWIEIEKPFWWDTPVWLATGTIDSIGIAQNHLQRKGMLANEAWGRPRDRNRFPGLHGNGRYTQDLYYRILNCGFRIPPSAGSASGVLQNPVGYNRVYVHLDGPLTWEKWWEGIRAGRVFVTDGPLLRVTANGRLPGSVLTSENGPLRVQLEGRLDSRDPIRSVELIQNGAARTLSLPATVEIAESGWFLVRAIADVDPTFRFASTGPWYVEIQGQRMKPVQKDAGFFLDWTRTRREMVSKAIKNPIQREEALKPQDEAIRFWEQRVEQSAP